MKVDVYAPSVKFFPVTLTFRDWEGFWFEGGRSCDCPRCRYIRYVVRATHLLPREPLA